MKRPRFARAPGGGRFPRVPWAALAVAVALAAVVSTLALSLVPTSGRTPYGDGWDDLSEFRSVVQGEQYAFGTVYASPLLLKDVPDPSRTLYVVAGAERSYSEEEALAVVDFFLRGGRLLVLEDTGSANQVSLRLGVQFDGVRLWDSAFDGTRDTAYVRVQIRLEKGAHDILTNLPTSLRVLERAPAGVRLDTIGESTRHSYIEQDGAEGITEGDLPGPFAVAVVLEHEASGGRALFLGDSHVIANALLLESSNRRFVAGVLSELLPSGGTVLLDASRLSHGGAGLRELVASAVASVRWPVLGLVPVGAALVALAAFAGLRRTQAARDAPLFDHRFAPDAPRNPPESPSAFRDRLARAAAAKLGLPRLPDDPETLRAAVPDPALARALAAPEAPARETWPDLVDRLRRLRG